MLLWNFKYSWTWAGFKGLTTDLLRACREFCELQINQLRKVTSNTFDKMNTFDSPLLMEEILHQWGRYIISIVYPETLAYTEQFFIIIWVLSAMIFFYQHTKEILANKSKGFLSAPASDFSRIGIHGFQMALVSRDLGSFHPKFLSEQRKPPIKPQKKMT